MHKEKSHSLSGYWSFLTMNYFGGILRTPLQSRLARDDTNENAQMSSYRGIFSFNISYLTLNEYSDRHRDAHFTKQPHGSVHFTTNCPGILR